MEYTTDSKEYRLAKFSAELADHFVEDAIIFYYLFTEMFLSIDQREKNSFPTYLTDVGKWIVLFYDADSSCGTDNKGNLSFDYYLEDIDHTKSGDPVYNGQNSVLWKNIRATKLDKIADMYKELRTSGAISYEKVIKKFEDHQSKWSEAIFNEDMHTKCIEPLVLKGDGTYLPMLQGKKEQWMKWWLYNRFRYLDSKYVTGTSMTNRIIMRPKAKANIFLTSYVNMYGRVYYNAAIVEHRMNRGEEYEFVWAASGAEDAVIGINDADMLTSIGDLSQHMVEFIDVSGATHITSLKIGDGSEGYQNLALGLNATSSPLTLGNNVLLRTLDVRNCPNLTHSIDISGCTNIEEVYFDGSSITGLKLPNGGILKKLHLPATMANLTLLNQTSLTEFVMPSYANVTTLWVEGATDAVPCLDILNSMAAGSRVRLTNVNWTYDTSADIEELALRLASMRGLDENGNNTEYAMLSGTVRVPTISRLTLERLNTICPHLTVVYGTIEDPVYVQILEKRLSGEYVNNRIERLGITLRRSEKLNKVVLGSAKTLDTSFHSCGALSYLDLGAAESLVGGIFYATYNLRTLIIRTTSAVCVLSSGISYSGISGGYIYVPSALVEEYKTATNWSAFAGRFRALEDYTVDGTVTGELDETKI